MKLEKLQFVVEDGVGINGKPLVTKNSFRYLHTLYNIGTCLLYTSIPIPSLDGTVTESSYSMPTVIHQLIPSYLIRGLL